jgi:hypothetical protein
MIASDATMSSVARRGMTTSPCHIHQLVVHLLVVRFLITLKTFYDLVGTLLTWSAFENRNSFLTKKLSLKSPHFVVPPPHLHQIQIFDLLRQLGMSSLTRSSFQICHETFYHFCYFILNSKTIMTIAPSSSSTSTITSLVGW